MTRFPSRNRSVPSEHPRHIDTNRADAIVRQWIDVSQWQSENSGVSLAVLYRINDNPVTETRWAATANGSGALSNNAIEFINGLTDNGALLVSVSDYNGTNHDLTFNLGAVSNLRSQIATVCRWPTASSADKAVRNEPTVSPQSSKPKARGPRPPNAPLELVR